ncbi:GNAT family N-acetyltransferase [Photobacterium sp. 1_MG-2023]|uniref:GNAT family N-acetyltransferase n=1 Tax=Photobacterium sp. 1_MG-2023 TaxID=3062646 RepID=UPI0026E181F0|nr:GNAT family N-acetyltransferase [Photobacterium sp. 1_MG-2023]MDO6706041.1 GNAT family N-acetyltransferase [Photobacterium sp. 1_MG-2023]
MSQIDIRPATIEDAPLILRFIQELATYEKQPHAVKATLKDIQTNLFDEHATAHAIICSVHQEPIGFAVYFYNYSTWLGKNGLYLEDVYVTPEYRQVGAGKAILKHLAQLALQKNCGRFEWCVLDWNEPAIRFYESIGAKPQSEWIIYRLTGDDLERFAKS